MTVSSRTPEGFPSHCPLCGAATYLEFSDPAGDAPCPHCGHLLWRSAMLLEQFRQVIAEWLGIAPELLTADTPLLNDLNADSLDVVELAMELEEEFDLDIPPEDAVRLRTLGDLIRYLEKGGNREQ